MGTASAILLAISMGVSFYAVLEYMRYDLPTPFGRLSISRDRELFAAIAFGDGGVTDGMACEQLREFLEKTVLEKS